MDIKPSKLPQNAQPVQKTAKNKLPRSAMFKRQQQGRPSDDATELKVPEELLGSGPKVQLLEPETPPRRSRRKLVLIIVAVAIAVLLAAGGGAVWWYNDALQPKSSEYQRTRVTIDAGLTPDQIAQKLQDQGIIKNALAFRILIKQGGDKPLQAGSYLFSPTQSAREVLTWLEEGRVDTLNVTIIPGQTLSDIKQVLVKDGFAAAEVDAAFAKAYNHPLLATKPANVNLDGYIYPETYQITSATTVEQLLEKTFDEFYAQIQAKNLIQQLAARGLNLHQGITLASIIQKEVSNSADKLQVAQVFEKRLKEDMPLGSDVTFEYAAELTGQTASPNLDSPYNTRKYKGLPPGAISNFTIDSLDAVANPASGDYLFFVAGEDGRTYFAKTDAEHTENIKKYCGQLCQ